jgi:hypothetical protein
MSLTPWLPVVRKIKDGERVEQDVVNVPLDQLTQRDQHLYEKFEELDGKSVLISFGQDIHPDESLSVGEMSVVYFKSSSTGVGLAKGVAGFSAAGSSIFSPNNSNYAFGIVKAVYTQTKTADLYTEGLCDLSSDIDDENLGLIQKINGVVEPFQIGPYFLSSKVSGKLTKDPSGIPVYIGYAISKRKFLLHAVIPEFSQFFVNYRHHLLDRVAGIPVKNNGVWTITASDTTKLGWIDAADASGSAPAGATFYYNIPNSLQIAKDYGLSAYERTEALELQKYLPPIPSNFIQLYVDGTLSRYKDVTDSTGTYSLNEYGLWWHNNLDGSQPWNASYPQTNSPGNWNPCVYWKYHETETVFTRILCTVEDIKGADSRAITLRLYNNFIQWKFDGVEAYTNLIAATNIPDFDSNAAIGGLDFNIETSGVKITIGEANRKRIFASFSQFNPALKTQLVHSLQTYNTATNKSGNFIKFYNREASPQQAIAGDLVVDIDAPVNSVGYSAAKLRSLADYPVTSDSSYAVGRAIAAFAYSKAEGAFKAVVTPVVSKLQGIGGVQVSEQVAGTGVWNIAYRGQGASGQVDSIEPINSRLEFNNLTSYLKLPVPSQTPTGLVGKIMLPKGYSNGSALNLVFHLFGDMDGTQNVDNRRVAFSFQYSAISAYNSASPGVSTKIDSTATYTAPVNPVEFDLTPITETYPAYTSTKVGYSVLAGVDVPLFSILGDLVHEDTIVNFKILRVATGISSTSYQGNVGVLGVYWEIPNA